MSAPTMTLGLLAKLGSLVVHCEEGLGERGHPFDLAAIRSIVNDAEVQRWLTEMRAVALVPEKR